jgi:hypothetical protein
MTTHTPIAHTPPNAEAVSGMSTARLPRAYTDGLPLPDGTTFKLAAVKAGSTTLILHDKPVGREGEQLLGGLCQLIAALPPFGGVTPEAKNMVAARKRLAERQRARRAEREAITAAE